MCYSYALLTLSHKNQLHIYISKGIVLMFLHCHVMYTVKTQTLSAIGTAIKNV